MSRVSQKAGLSPSITKGSNAIDLGRNSGVDMGRKAQPSVTSGGIGITQEVTNIAGVSVSAGANVDITPLDFNISVNPSEGTLSIATGAEIPGGFLGISGGIEVETNTGQVIGGSIGGEALGLGINVSNSSKGGIGIEFTVQIPGTPIELSLGFGFPPPKKPLPSPAPAPAPTSSPFNPENLPTSFPCPNGRWEVGVYAHVNFHPRLFPFDTGFALAHEAYVRNSYNPYAMSEPPSIAQQHIEHANRRWGEGNWEMETYTSERHIITAGVWIFYDNDGKMLFSTNPDRDKSIKLYRQAKFNFFYPTLSWTKYEDRYYWGFTSSPFDFESVLMSVFPPPECPLIPSPTPSPVPTPTTTPSPSLSPSPFPNPPPRKRNMDVCCRESTKLLREIYRRLGISKFPGKLPETIIQETPKEGEQPAEPSQVPIEDFVDLLSWQFERDDERWGQWQVELDIKDADITKEGDQKKQIKLPNLAESIGEFQGQLLSIVTNVDALVALQIKTLAESGMARQEAIKGYLAAKAIIKYMAFKSTEIDVTVPLTFTAGAETISELLNESEGHIKGTDYEEKETLRDVIADLLQAAAIIRAVHWQRIDTKSDPKSQLLNILKGSVDLAATITKPRNPNGDNNEDFDPEKDFEDFIDSVEDGFRNATGITDGQNPYGKSPDRRPRIRQIGDNISQAGGKN
jgi:hypothetical protein